ncbi:hypothetical protein GQ53DRAFT_737430 [Thozetella sp. PMI_491]|nr:hypothetical protein GQ53DRAFT_737430 [Thozetella sp. PMI_491]
MREKASGTFLWVAIVVNELRLRKVSSRAMSDFMKELPAGLSQLYSRIMSQIQQLARVDREYCLSMLSRAAVACRPLTLLELAAMAGLPDDILEHPEEIEEIVKLCGSFLTIRRKVVYLVHQSARDYLTSSAAADLVGSGIDQIHYDMFSQALAVMNKVLRRDIYGLHAPGCSIDEAKAPRPDPLGTARYACMFWVDHLEGSGPGERAMESLRDGGAIYAFLQQKYLYWLESLSLLRRISKGVLSIAKLVDLLKDHPAATQLIARVRDAHRFLLTYRMVIENWPLQIYVSALVFSPTRSITRQTFEKDIVGWITDMPSMEDSWDACQQTLEGKERFTSIAFSSSGTLASGTVGGSIKIWNPATGRCRITIVAHRSDVLSLTFSGAGLLASGSRGTTVKLWDDATGECQRVLDGNNNGILSLAFPSTNHVASGSADGTVKVWDIGTGQCVRTITTQSKMVPSVVALSASQPLAAIAAGQSVKIYDVFTGQCQGVLQLGQNSYDEMVFSSSGSLALAESLGETILLWDTTTGHSRELQCDAMVASLTFLDSGELLSGSSSGLITVWDTTGKTVQTLKCHTDRIQSMALMPNSSLFATLATSNTIKLWDIEDLRRQRFEGHSSTLDRLISSDASGQVVTIAADGTMKLWNANGKCQKTLDIYDGENYAVALSRDGIFLASAPYDNGIRLCDLTSERESVRFGDRHDLVTLLVFSYDTQLLASASLGGTVRIWDLGGQCRLVLKGHGDRLLSLAFSADSSLIAVSTSRSTKLWAADTGIFRKELDITATYYRHTLAFSPDGRLLVSSLHGREGDLDTRHVGMWDVATGQCHYIFQVAGGPYDISYDATGAWLYTDMGAICLDELPDLKVTSPCESSGLVLSKPTRFHDFGRDKNSEWIMKDSKRLVWLPPDHRSDHWVVKGSTVWIGSPTGKPLVFSFAPGESAV